jgi:hypothetical protein
MTAMIQPQSITHDQIGVYVQCSDYCGLRIYDGDQDHAAGCGAPPEEKARILRELGAAKIKAASEETEPAEVAWRCSCGETFPSQDDLAGHHTDSGHQGMFIEGEIRIDADGAAAKVKRAPKAPAQPAPTPPWQDPHIDAAMVYAAQRSVDEEEVKIRGTGTCPGRELIEGVEVACPHVVFTTMIDVRTCIDSVGDAHTHKKAKMAMCLIHTVRAFGSNLAPAGNGPLFG